MPAGRALITGITGQDGSLLAELLLDEGWAVTGVVRPPLDRDLANLEAIAGRVDLVAADLLDPAGAADVVREAAPERIFHLAAPTFVPASWRDPAETLTAIAGATGAVLVAARDLGARVLIAASPEIFGDAGESPQHEDSPKRPRTPYGVAKLAAHELVRVLREGDGLHACSTILYNHESTRRQPHFVTRKITRGVAAIAAGREERLTLGDLAAVRDWSHARDIVRGMHLALAHPEPGDYVLAGGVGRTVGDFVEAAFAAAGIEADGRVEVDPALVRAPEATPMVGDASRARAVLGWSPEIGFEELVREMVEADLRSAAG